MPLQIAARELRLVQVHQVEAPAVGQPATFQLLRRPRDSIIPQELGSEAPGSPAAAAGPSTTAGSAGGGAAAAANRFCKFALVGDATPMFVAEAQRLAQHAAQVG